jgi:hypothetical protein
MGHWLAPPGAAKTFGHPKRFDARYWTVNFPRPMMASVVTTGPHSLRVDAVFYRQDDLAGLIWEAEDRLNHRLLRFETARDFRKCRLRFGELGTVATKGEAFEAELGGSTALLQAIVEQTSPECRAELGDKGAA